MPCRYIGTMSEKYPAGFYTAAGPLPFFIGKAASEEYLIFLAGNFKNSYEAVQYFRKHIRPQVSKKNTN